MTQYVFNEGSELVIADLDVYKTMDASVVVNNEFRVIVDGSEDRTIILPPVASLGTRTTIFCIVSINRATPSRSVTILPTDGSGDKINGDDSLSFTITGNAATVQALYDNQYFTPNWIRPKI